MPNDVPMVHGRAGLFERISRSAPFAGGSLAREHESGNARPSKFFELRGTVLATAVLRVQRLSHVVMQMALRNRVLAVAFPPDREQIGERLPAPISLLRLAHPFGPSRTLLGGPHQRAAPRTREHPPPHHVKEGGGFRPQGVQRSRAPTCAIQTRSTPAK